MDSPQVALRSDFKARVGWVDTAKGFGIILVVFGHVLRGLVSSHLMTPGRGFHYVDGWIYSFHMPLFFVLSGLFLARSAMKSSAEFTFDKIRTIAYPYIVWSLTTLLLKAALGEIVNYPRSLSELPRIFYQPMEQFWFLYVLFFLTVGFGVLLKLGMKPWAVLLAAYVAYPGVLPIPFSGWEPAEQIRGFAIFLAMGTLLGASRIYPRLPRSGFLWLLLLVALGFLVVSSPGVFFEPQPSHVLDALLALSGTAGCISLALLVNRTKADAIFSLLGRYSLEIFVAHTMASAAVRIMLQKVVHMTALAPYVLLCTLAGLLLPVLAAVALERCGLEWVFILPKLSGGRTLDNPAKASP